MTIAWGAAVSMLVLAGCGGDSAVAGGGSGEGVEYGATVEEYQEAFADAEPIELTSQLSGPKGSVVTAQQEDYYAALEEWSGGKLTVQRIYSDGVAPAIQEHVALADGRLDIGKVISSGAPEDFPVNALLEQTSFLGSKSPLVGHLATQAWMLEAAYGNEEFGQETKDEGVKTLMPAYSIAATAVECPDKRTGLDDFSGATAAVGAATTSKQAQALGMSPSTLEFNEYFESLQRGVVECVVTGSSAAQNMDIMDIAPHAVIDPDAGFGMTPATLGMSLDQWEQLPLLAQQLIYDKLDVIIKSNIEANMNMYADYITSLQDAGGDVYPFEEDARKAVQDTSAELLTEVREGGALPDQSGFVDSIEESASKWEKIVTDELGYEDEVDYAGIPGWWEVGKVDFQPFADRIMEDFIVPQRPS